MPTDNEECTYITFEEAGNAILSTIREALIAWIIAREEEA